ncbi:MAG: hypothetical protein ACFFDN_28200 [Candidatus Hodarchaeota archaeon]
MKIIFSLFLAFIFFITNIKLLCESEKQYMIIQKNGTIIRTKKIDLEKYKSNEPIEIIYNGYLYTFYKDNIERIGETFINLFSKENSKFENNTSATLDSFYLYNTILDDIKIKSINFWGLDSNRYHLIEPTNFPIIIPYLDSIKIKVERELINLKDETSWIIIESDDSHSGNYYYFPLRQRPDINTGEIIYIGFHPVVFIYPFSAYEFAINKGTNFKGKKINASIPLSFGYNGAITEKLSIGGLFNWDFYSNDFWIWDSNSDLFFAMSIGYNINFSLSRKIDIFSNINIGGIEGGNIPVHKIILYSHILAGTRFCLYEYSYNTEILKIGLELSFKRIFLPESFSSNFIRLGFVINLSKPMKPTFEVNNE